MMRGTLPAAWQSAAVGHAPSSYGTTSNASATPTTSTASADTVQRFTSRGYSTYPSTTDPGRSSAPVRVHAGRAAGATLMQQIPALVQADLQILQPIPVRVGRLAECLPLEQLVFLVRQLVDRAQNVLVGHACLPRYPCLHATTRCPQTFPGGVDAARK